ncbi:response regulator [Magnetospirillum fulvum]|uniref:Hpt domain-containing protein n=1 Tax=Magnetospirillum fulvum TaxID=1082 RepID=A0A1H6HD20_MAGFU|nr:response regulator [Magnetospirillum fulvum]SEH32018.1 Hpt domain-containing protein [Magnetospirillum fulvum]
MAARTRILVVDDNEVNRTVAADLLDRSGYSVVTAEDGLAALAAVRAACFDLILLDMRMPGMDGIETAAAIHAALGSPPPMLLLTATLIPEDEPRWRRAGLRGCLVKPFRVEQIAPFLTVAPPSGLSGLVARSDLDLDLTLLGRERMIALADLFRRSSGADLDRLLALAAAGKTSEVAATAHRMAGAAASLHLHPLSALCREIESTARRQDAAVLAALVERVPALWEVSLATLVEALEAAEPGGGPPDPA